MFALLFLFCDVANSFLIGNGKVCLELWRKRYSGVYSRSMVSNMTEESANVIASAHAQSLQKVDKVSITNNYLMNQTL